MNAQMTNAKLLFAALAVLLLGAVSCNPKMVQCPAYSHQPASKSLDRKVWGSDEAPREVRNKTAHYRYKGQRSQLADFFSRR
ncbi:hypothetical protein C8N40_11178 [Pontibacter mucosus]|uniref:Secreted protein n=1 Tax=Pontibacter mucosus TaxID=1649266 RepID=A0A2T5YD40_9BACT|nr:hypothetical protein [Pontibacter mucosus]PTX14413.1 hypothetical protein C8N40_11178 [Pontibacter mucosus]